jgi:hypothetical protein
LLCIPRELRIHANVSPVTGAGIGERRGHLELGGFKGRGEDDVAKLGVLLSIDLEAEGAAGNGTVVLLLHDEPQGG